MTGCTSATSGCPRNATRVGRSIGSPAISRYCLGTSPPARSPRPPATTMAATVPVIKPLLPAAAALAYVRASANRCAHETNSLGNRLALHERHGYAQIRYIAVQHLRDMGFWLDSMQWLIAA